MAVIIGIVIVLAGIFGGFALEGGHLGPLYQPYELIMIAGGALGAFVISNDAKSRRATLAALPTDRPTARSSPSFPPSSPIII